MAHQKPPADLENAVRIFESLQRHIQSLDQSMLKLADRILPFDDEPKKSLGLPPRMDPLLIPAGDPSIELLISTIRRADAHIEAIERDFASVRSKIENLEENNVLRDELLPYLKPKRGRG